MTNCGEELISVAGQRSTPLRTVAPSERAKPKPKAAQSVADAALSGDHRALLVAMRERIAQTVSNPACPPRDLAALTRRLQDIAKEIEGIDLRRRQEGEQDGELPGDGEFGASAI